MAKFTTIKKKEDGKDEQTFNVADYLIRSLGLKQRETDKLPEIPNTESNK